MMHTTSSFADALGRQNMASALGVGLKMISKAVVSGKYPASWFLIINDLANAAGISCPSHLFDFKKGGDAVPASQDHPTESHTSAILPTDL